VNRLRTSAALGALIIVLVACGPAAETESGEASTEASTAASVAASEPQASDGGPQPSFSAGLVADLEALIPDTVGDLTMDKTSFRGNEYLDDPGSDPATVAFLQQVGVSPSDISMAIGFGFSSDGSSFAAMFVIRAEGADSSALVSAFQEAMNQGGASPLEWSSATVGGKQVQVAAAASGSTYLYANGDIVFWINASDVAIAEEILSGLP